MLSVARWKLEVIRQHKTVSESGKAGERLGAYSSRLPVTFASVITCVS